MLVRCHFTVGWTVEKGYCHLALTLLPRSTVMPDIGAAVSDDGAASACHSVQSKKVSNEFGMNRVRDAYTCRSPFLGC